MREVRVEKERFKRFLAVLVLLLAAASVMTVLSQSGRLVRYVTSGADPASAFHRTDVLPPDTRGRLGWLPDDLPRDSRAVEPRTRSEVEGSYLRAWQQLGLAGSAASLGHAHDTAAVRDLGDYFSGRLLRQLRSRLRSDPAGSVVRDVSHRLRVTFYSDDGSILAFADERAELVRLAGKGNRQAILDSVERWKVVMILEDGNWRVRQWVRVSGVTRTPDDPLTGPSRPLPDLRGVNYEPRETPFSRQWSETPLTVVEADLDRVRDLGLDSVRIFVPYAGFGPGAAEAHLRLREVLDAAHARGIRVVVTLFDGYTTYLPDEWAATRRWVGSVVAPLASHPAVVLWDVKNEPDRDVARGGSAEVVRGWLSRTVRQIRAQDSDTAVTVGWSTPAAAAALGVPVDVVSFHYYGPVDQFDAEVGRLRARHPGLPLLLSEFGLPTDNSWWPGGHTEREQASYVAQMLARVRGSRLSGALVWTLYDLEHAPPDAGWLPWRTGAQRTLGLLRADGSEKPAAAYVGRSADLSSPPALPWWARLEKHFVQGTAVLLSGAVAWLLLRRRTARSTRRPGSATGPDS